MSYVYLNCSWRNIGFFSRLNSTYNIKVISTSTYNLLIWLLALLEFISNIIFVSILKWFCFAAKILQLFLIMCCLILFSTVFKFVQALNHVFIKLTRILFLIFSIVFVASGYFFFVSIFLCRCLLILQLQYNTIFTKICDYLISLILIFSFLFAHYKRSYNLFSFNKL